MSKRTFALNRFGYITKWLVSGPLETPVDPATRTIVDQGQYERYLKETIHEDSITSVPSPITLGAPGIAGKPWRFYQAGENYFVDCSRFYFTVHRCEFWGATVLVSDGEKDVEADVWSYTSVDLWLNGEHVYREPVCAYSPMRRARVTLHVKAGENLLFLQMQNSCTRDTRNIAALSFPDPDAVRVAYPGEESAELRALEDAAQWLHSVRFRGDALVADGAAPAGFAFTDPHMKELAWGDGSRFPIDGSRGGVGLSVTLGDTVLTRRLELSATISFPKEIHWDSVEDCRASLFNELADTLTPATERTYRANYVRLAPDRPLPDKIAPNNNLYYNTYARLALGRGLSDFDRRVIAQALTDADEHHDCSDFRFCYILKSVLEDLLPADVVEAVHKTALAYSYWMDEPAVGAMCYNSENHALLFHSCQMMAGMLWPDEIFTRSGRTGREEEAIARDRIDKWMERIEARGFAEFLSGGYTPITVAALLAVHDFGGDDFRRRAAKLLDKIFYDIALNAFDGIVSCPQGRIYRSVLTPWVNGTQALFYLATGRGAPQTSEWLAAFAHTKYKIPDDVLAHSETSGMHAYFSAGTKIQTYKSEGFMITSLPLPLVGEGEPGPFKPGGKGYQQHLFYACLGGAANVFVHHPGGSHDGTQIRPGYWYGNGYFPTVEQHENLLAAVYRLDENHPIRFTHAYFPTRAFDEVIADGAWLFGRRGASYLGLWCSRELTLHDEDITQGCDFRAEGGSAGWLIVCGDATIAPDFDAFRAYAKATAPAFDEASLTLAYAGNQLVFPQ